MPKCSGVGINDWTHGRADTWSDYMRKVYKTWNSMLRRCYNSKAQEYSSYGARGCIVCERWKTLSNFAEDIKKLPNYDKWLNGGYEFDKDIRLGHCQIYDLDHCMFVLKRDNVIEEVNRCWSDPLYRDGYICKGKSVLCVETGVIYSSAGEAQRVTGIHNATISKVCRGIGRSAGGYHWQYV